MGATWSEEGLWTVTVLVVDQDSCGSTAKASVWVAENDGEPAGPVLLSTDSDTMIAASSTSGRVTVDVEATDCTGDPSAGGQLLVRTDLGEIDNSSSAISASGSGLVVTLDGDGLSSFDWTVESQGYAGDASLHMGVESSAAYGNVQVEVTGDSVSPIVLQADPAGSTYEIFDSAEILFSEPMLESSIGSGTVTLTEPDGSEAAITEFQLSSDGRSLVMILDQSADAGEGTWTTGLSLNIRDDSGNRLDGRYTGSASAFALEFGDVASAAPDISSCSASPDEIYPDGDDGGDEEADLLTLSFAADSMPGWWEVEILDVEGQTIWLSRSPAASANSTMEWEGRGLDGMIAPSGVYFAIITALDDSWNAGIGCTVDLQIDQHLEDLD
jgi:hypothetical protein